MPNKNYQKGARKEYKICNHLKKSYDIVQRTAGSHSPIDIIAINKRLKKILLIQAKPDDYANSKTKKLLIENRELNGVFLVKFVVI